MTQESAASPAADQPGYAQALDELDQILRELEGSDVDVDRLADRVAILLGGRLLAVRPVNASGSVRVRARADMAAAITSMLRTLMPGAKITEQPQADGMACWQVRTAEPGDLSQIVTRLAAVGIGVVEMSETGADLEETFLAVTSGKALH